MCNTYKAVRFKARLRNRSRFVVRRWNAIHVNSYFVFLQWTKSRLFNHLLWYFIHRNYKNAFQRMHYQMYKNQLRTKVRWAIIWKPQIAILRWYTEWRLILYRIMWLFCGELPVNAAGESWAEVIRMERVRDQTDLPCPWDNHNYNHNNNEYSNNNHNHYNNNGNNNPTNDDKQTKYHYFLFSCQDRCVTTIHNAKHFQGSRDQRVIHSQSYSWIHHLSW